MSALDGRESCDHCGSVLVVGDRIVLEPGDCVPELGVGEYLRFVCPNNCTEVYVRADELVIGTA